MRLIAFLLLTFGFLKNSSAQVVYSFLPNPATAADAVRLRIDIFKCFDHVLVTSVDANAKTVTVRFNGDDDLCDDTVPANTVTPPIRRCRPTPAGCLRRPRRGVHRFHGAVPDRPQRATRGVAGQRNAVCGPSAIAGQRLDAGGGCSGSRRVGNLPQVAPSPGLEYRAFTSQKLL